MKNKIIHGMVALFATYSMTGCTAINLGTTFMGFSDDTQKAYAGMMDTVSETGDPAQAMMKEWIVIDKDLKEEEIFEEMKSLAGDYNMRYVGEKNMFRIKDAKADEVAHARIAEFCSLSIAKKMLNHSRYYGGFMPCRIIYVEYGDGRRYLITMDMTLAIYGGTDKKPIAPALMEDMKNVKIAMEQIPLEAIGYENQEEYDKKLATIN